MAASEQYVPSPSPWVRDQVDLYESSGGTDGTTLRGVPVVVLTMTGATSGKTRKVPLMRVEHDGRYAAVASMGGAPKNPVWYNNLVTNPVIELQDHESKRTMRAREVRGEEKAQWWQRAVAVWPDYNDYQARTERSIPVFVLEPFEG